MSSIHPIYEFSDYREYVENALASKSIGRGGKQRLAEHLGCQPSFISQVLKGRNELSFEHAYKVNGFLSHREPETDYFMTMIQMNKAGSEPLRLYYRDQLSRMRTEHLKIENLVDDEPISDAQAIEYYGNWDYVKMHLLISIHSYRPIEALKKKMGISEEAFDEALDFLTRTGLVTREGDSLRPGRTWIHLSKGSPVAQAASIAARLKVIENLDLRDEGSLNYGLHFAVSEEGFESLRKSLLELIASLAESDRSYIPSKFCTLVIDLIEH